MKGWGGNTRMHVLQPDDGSKPDGYQRKYLFSAQKQHRDDDAGLSIDFSKLEGALSKHVVKPQLFGKDAMNPEETFAQRVRSPTAARAAFMENRNPTLRDQHELSECMVADWVFNTIPKAQQSWTSAHVINSDNAAEWSAQDVVKSQEVPCVSLFFSTLVISSPLARPLLRDLPP